MDARDLHRRWGTRCRDRRKTLGLSQEDLAGLADVPQATISRLENGGNVPDAVKFRIAAGLKCTVDELFQFPAVVPPLPVSA